MLDIAILVGAFLAGGIVAMLAERAFHASGRHGLHLRPLRPTAGLRRARIQPSSDELEQMLRAYDLLSLIARSPLSRVIGVGAAQIFDGITVECISIELREAGGRGLVRVHSSQGYRPPQNPPNWLGEPAPPNMHDDLGTEYAVGWSSWGGGGGGDDHSEFTGEFWFVPVPPVAAGRLAVSIPQLDPSGGAPEQEGPPWLFDVPL